MADRKSSSVRWIAALMMALSGVFFFFAVLVQDLRAPNGLNTETAPWGLVIRYVVAMAFGGALAGLLTSGLFGRRGVFAWPLALLGGIVASIFAGAFGGAFGKVPELLRDGWQSSDFIPIAAGAMILPFAADARPSLLLVWLAIVIATHIWVRRARHSSVRSS